MESGKYEDRFKLQNFSAYRRKWRWERSGLLWDPRRIQQRAASDLPLYITLVDNSIIVNSIGTVRRVWIVGDNLH